MGKKKNAEKEKTILERFVEDLQKISLVQKTVLLKKDFYTSDAGKTSIINFKMDYIGDKEIAISDVTELITLLKLSDLSSNTNFEIKDTGIALSGNRNMFYKCADRTIVPYITKIEDGGIETALEYDDEIIKINITEEDFIKTKSVLSKITDSIVVLKKMDDEIKFVVIDKESPERFMIELFSFPIETDKIEDFDVIFLSKEGFNSMVPSDYSCTISKIVDDEYKVVFVSKTTNYSISGDSPILQDFKVSDISKLIDKFLKKSSKKTKSKKINNKKKKEEKKVVIEDEEEVKNEVALETEKTNENIPEDLDDLDLNDDDFFDDDDFE
ncbi:MAG: hypothetical protein ACOC1K_00010 [Nanoarchaeota archaeon]